jgi:hypothetical protein
MTETVDAAKAKLCSIVGQGQENPPLVSLSPNHCGALSVLGLLLSNWVEVVPVLIEAEAWGGQ